MPRLSEKTLELTICSQISFYSGHLMTWFGLTQRQEAKAGFDACTALNGRLFIFQFKASNQIIRSGARRFIAPHIQMEKLQGICQGLGGVVYYVFPLIGNTEELVERPNVLEHTYLLDVANLPNPMGEPTTKSGILRRSGHHYIDINPPSALIHSKPIEVTVTKATEVAHKMANLPGLMPSFVDDFEKFDAYRAKIGHKIYGLILH